MRATIPETVNVHIMSLKQRISYQNGNLRWCGTNSFISQSGCSAQHRSSTTNSSKC